MTLEDKTNTALIFRTVTVFILIVIVFIAALLSPKHQLPDLSSDASIPLDQKEKLHMHYLYNSKYHTDQPFDVSIQPLDMNQISNWKYWMDKHGTTRCHYHDAIYHLGTDCSSQQCYAYDDNNPTFDNQLLFETEKIWYTNPKFIKQIENINQSLYNFIEDKKVSLHTLRMDLNINRGKNNENKIILNESNIKIYWIHMAMEYFCCYNKKQYEQIVDAMKNFEFKPFEIGFDRYLCIGGENNKPMNIVLFVDAKGQEYLARLTDRFEEHLRDEYGINIHSHRRDAQPFHVTLMQFEESAMDDENEKSVIEIVSYLNENYKWENIKLTVEKSSICMNDKQMYEIEYSCF